MRPGASRRFVNHFGSLVVLLNVLVATLSLGDMYILASGAVSVELPDEDDFSWHLDPGRASIVFSGNYTVRNRGFYDITGLDIRASVSSEDGVRIVSYDRSGRTIPAFGGGRYPIVAELPLENLLELDFGSMLFCATHFRIHVEVDASYLLGLARFSSRETIRYPWTPPLRDLEGLFRDGRLARLLSDALPFLREAAAALQARAASAMIAPGATVTWNVGPVDLGFRYLGGLLDVTVLKAGPVPSELFRVSLDLLQGGGDDGA